MEIACTDDIVLFTMVKVVVLDIKQAEKNLDMDLSTLDLD